MRLSKWWQCFWVNCPFKFTLKCSLCRRHTRFLNRAFISCIFAETFFPHCVIGAWCMFLYNEGGKTTKGKKKYGPLAPWRLASLLRSWGRYIQSDFLWACPQILKWKYAFSTIRANGSSWLVGQQKEKNTHWDVSVNVIKEKSSACGFDSMAFSSVIRPESSCRKASGPH